MFHQRGLDGWDVCEPAIEDSELELERPAQAELLEKSQDRCCPDGKKDAQD